MFQKKSIVSIIGRSEAFFGKETGKIIEKCGPSCGAHKSIGGNVRSNHRRCSIKEVLKICKIHGKMPVSESLFFSRHSDVFIFNFRGLQFYLKTDSDTGVFL